MATSLQVNLTQTLRSTLNYQGVFVYAVYFNKADGSAVWTTIVDGTNASPVVNASTAIPLTGAAPLPSEYESGKVYFLIQSLAPGTSSDLQTQIEKESDLNWDKATNLSFRYDSFELNLGNSSFDQGNLTSVNGFGIPMSVDVNGDTRGYKVTGATLFQDIINYSATGSQDWTYQAGPLTGQQRMVLSPAEAVANSALTPAAFLAADWSDYVTALQDATSDVVIAGYFNGAPSGVPGSKVWHNAGFYSYQLSWDGTYFWLSPTASSEIKGYIRILPGELENSIYSTLGTADIFTNLSDPTPYLASMNTGDNNQWGEVFTQFLTGFMAGYYGGSGAPLNPTSLTTPLAEVDLGKTWNWDPTYAFGHHGTNALTSGFTGSANKYDPYAEWFFDNSNSYGAGYSDNLMSAFPAGGPLISLWDSSTNADAATIVITLYDDNETPAGYVQPVMYNYRPAPGGGYAVPAQFVGDGLNIGLSLSSATMMVQDDTPISFAFYNGGGSGTFTTLSLPTGQSIFQNWNIMFDAGTGTYALQSFGSNLPGNILFNQIPVAVGGGVTWYQITVGSGPSAKIFNLYATTDASNHFVNPSYTGQETAVQVDGLATVAADKVNPTVETFTVDLFAGLPSALLTQITDQTIINDPTNGSFPTPHAPVVGSLSSHDAFTQLAAPGAYNPTVANGALAFGWNGADSAANNDISAYTNKIGALNVARMSFRATTTLPPGVDLMPVIGTADVDGNWVTGTAQFGNGTYIAVMNEFLVTDQTFITPLQKPSAAQTFTVHLATLALGATADGLQLTADGSGTSGNWIRLETTHSTLLNGTVLVYATDAAGNLVGRDGSLGVTLDQAVLARIGAVASDNGTSLFRGGHSVYLPVGLEMHFAVLSGDGVIHDAPSVTFSPFGSLEVILHTGAGVVELTASVDNTLSLEASIAFSQKVSDTPWVYLTGGATVSVEFAGSAANINTAHFVRIDIDPTTGGWSVGDVAYGDTDAFRDAVRSNWDAGLSLKRGGGTFTDHIDWTVAGPSGFYAPVLAAADGDIFVIGDANRDGRAHVRMFGENIFGFEDLKSWQGSDFDFNDMIVKLSWDIL